MAVKTGRCQERKKSTFIQFSSSQFPVLRTENPELQPGVDSCRGTEPGTSVTPAKVVVAVESRTLLARLDRRDARRSTQNGKFGLGQRNSCLRIGRPPFWFTRKCRLCNNLLW